MIQLTELHITVPFIVKQDTQNLTNLHSLHVDYKLQWSLKDQIDWYPFE